MSKARRHIFGRNIAIEAHCSTTCLSLHAHVELVKFTYLLLDNEHCSSVVYLILGFLVLEKLRQTENLFLAIYIWLQNLHLIVTVHIWKINFRYLKTYENFWKSWKMMYMGIYLQRIFIGSTFFQYLLPKNTCLESKFIIFQNF